MRAPCLLERYGGHRQAAGLELRIDRLRSVPCRRSTSTRAVHRAGCTGARSLRRSGDPSWHEATSNCCRCCATRALRHGQPAAGLRRTQRERATATPARWAAASTCGWSARGRMARGCRPSASAWPTGCDLDGEGPARRGVPADVRTSGTAAPTAGAAGGPARRVVRIIAGRWRGRRSRRPPAQRTRPTTDRVREAWMSTLQLDLPGPRVLDLFAGSGARSGWRPCHAAPATSPSWSAPAPAARAAVEHRQLGAGDETDGREG
jgi:hypothetical protein